MASIEITLEPDAILPEKHYDDLWKDHWFNPFPQDLPTQWTVFMCCKYHRKRRERILSWFCARTRQIVLRHDGVAKNGDMHIFHIVDTLTHETIHWIFHTWFSYEEATELDLKWDKFLKRWLKKAWILPVLFEEFFPLFPYVRYDTQSKLN